MKIIFSKKCLNYFQIGHPESPERIRGSYKLLKEKGFSFLKPTLAKEQDILKVHSEELVKKVKTETFFNLDSPAYKNIFYYASLSVGAAILAMETALKENFSFSLMRPPGHHASKNSLGGFCYFNNIAIATTKALKDRVRKVAILDIDIHHGNGTQDIFLNDGRVIYVSLHQFPAYPGTGEKSVGNCFNYPLPTRTGEEEYLRVLKKALTQVKRFNPDLVAVSAGFDTYKEDPLADFELKIKSYKKIGELIRNLRKPTFSVLEGGYSSVLGDCIYSYLKGFK